MKEMSLHLYPSETARAYAECARIFLQESRAAEKSADAEFTDVSKKPSFLFRMLKDRLKGDFLSEDQYRNVHVEGAKKERLEHLQKSLNAFAEQAGESVECNGRYFNDVIEKLIVKTKELKPEWQSLDLYYGSNDSEVSTDDNEYAFYIDAKDVQHFNDLLKSDSFAQNVEETLRTDEKLRGYQQEFRTRIENLKTIFNRAAEKKQVILVSGSN